MASTCNNPQQVVLQYFSVLPREVSLRTDGHLPRTPGSLPALGNSAYTSLKAINPESVITWNFEPNPSGNLLEYNVSYSVAASPSLSPRTFKAYFAGNETNLGFTENEEGHLHWAYTKGDGESQMGGSIAPGEATNNTWFTSYPFQIVEQPQNPPREHLIFDIQFTSGGTAVPPENLPYSFIWNLYIDNQWVKKGIHRSKTSTPPEGLVKIIDAQTGSLQTNSFEFEETPISVDLKQKSGTNYTHQIIAKHPDKTESVIYEFYGINPTLICFSAVGECPDNTCQVDCGEHYCCYQNDGISIYSFLK